MTSSQYIIDSRGNKVAIILPMEKYNEMLSALEELNDIKLYDSVKAKNEESMMVNEAFDAIEN